MEKNNNKVLDGRIFKTLHFVYIILIAVITVYIVWENPISWKEILFFALIFSSAEIYRHFGKRINENMLIILPIIQILSVIPLGLLSKSAVSMWFILIINLDVIIEMGIKYSLTFSICSYLIYISIYLIKLNPPSLVSAAVVVLIAVIQYSIIMGMGFIAKNFYTQKNKLRELLAKQKVQMLELEQLAIVEERNRMAGEIHDSVGHKLTTALVQLEATMMILDSENNEAIERMNIVREQTKEALEDLRLSVRALKTDYYESLEEMLFELKSRVKKTTDVDVHTDFTNVDLIPFEYRKTIYHMVMEAITNGIKHGKCTNIYISINFDKKKILVEIANDGTLNDVLPGFGLKQIKENTENLGGDITCGEREGLFYLTAVFMLSEVQNGAY